MRNRGFIDMVGKGKRVRESDERWIDRVRGYVSGCVKGCIDREYL